ncbi:MAG: alpha/beta fold hydrolase [Paracoccaceae bacterium]|nr:alpha/beta fold hydrolase [Paracoccaceae bacterium]MDG1736854.1 alpha/beta fold hydrolase [Paracoccaceae bacterium]MDG2260476.1 alpha/beta fold hydrolase [Paracoccaceae bacterium]
MLNFVENGTQSDKKSLLIAHGLFGSARNWGVIAKRLSEDRHIVTVDMRNHGESLWHDSHTYDDLAGDLAEIIGNFGGNMDVLGHSMGGKAGMVLALTQPELVNRLLVADIAPIAYAHTQSPLIDAMKSLDLSKVEKRSDADKLLAELIPETSVRAFLIQSLDVKAGRWRLNHKALAANMDQIIGFPERMTGLYEGPTLFLSGGASDYVLPEHRPEIKRLFANPYFAKIPDVGHWLHAEKPREFEASIRAFFDA